MLNQFSYKRYSVTKYFQLPIDNKINSVYSVIKR
nr:MAG TPA: hypothetical protein [Caudoviricetes sp.]DAY92962.1 MAG TPA: hypothetical protein [Caudoviricetes sp.]